MTSNRATEAAPPALAEEAAQAFTSAVTEGKGSVAVTLAAPYTARDGKSYKADSTTKFDESEAHFLIATGRARLAD